MQIPCYRCVVNPICVTPCNDFNIATIADNLEETVYTDNIIMLKRVLQVPGKITQYPNLERIAISKISQIIQILDKYENYLHNTRGPASIRYYDDIIERYYLFRGELVSYSKWRELCQ